MTSILCQMEDNLNIEDNINNLSNGRQSQYFVKWKTTSIFCKIDENLNMMRNGRQPQSFVKLKTISILENGGQPFLFWEMEEDLNNWYMEDDTNVLKLVAQLNFLLGRDGLARPSLS